MRITLDAKCFKTSENGKVFQAVLVEDGEVTLATEPAPLPTKHEKWGILAVGDNDPWGAFVSLYDSRESAEREFARVSKDNPKRWRIAHVTWED